MDNSPYEFILNSSEGDQRALMGFVHRTFNEVDLIFLVNRLGELLREYNSMENIFFIKSTSSIEETLIQFRRTLFANYLDSIRTLWVAGNGGAASTASHAVADLTKTLQQNKNHHVKCISLSEMNSLTTAVSNDISFESSISVPLKLLAQSGDGILLFSVSGTSPNIISALQAAKQIGVKSCVVFGENGIDVARSADVAVIIPSRDYQVVENIHLVLLHWLAKSLESK
jgi:phosphoheptose isomerase